MDGHMSEKSEELPQERSASWVGPVGVSMWSGHSHESSGWRGSRIMPHEGIGFNQRPAGTLHQVGLPPQWTSYIACSQVLLGGG